MGRRGKKRAGRCSRKNKQTNVKEAAEPKELTTAPHTFVMYRGDVGVYARELVSDLRKVMEPFTASSLKVLKKNSIKDFLSVAGMLHVTHFCVVTRTDVGAYLKISRVPRGPTLSFRVHNYTLTRDVISTLKKQVVFSRQFEHPPLLVLNGFSGGGMHIKLIASTFQNMFPTINLIKVDLSNVHRCVLLNYDSVSNLIDFRHFAIKVVPTGISKSVKKIVQSKVPNLSRYQDISEFLINPMQLSESEAEDDPSSHVILPQNLSSRGNFNSNVSAIRVVEIGPRLTLELLKLESGFFGGDILHHSIIEKSEEEIKLIKKRIDQKHHLKEKRKGEQKENLKKKERIKEYLKEKSMKGMQLKYGEVIKTSVETLRHQDERNESNYSEDDTEWYREEVGEDPEPGLFTTTSSGSIKRKKPTIASVISRKKRKESRIGVPKESGKVKKYMRKKY